MEGISNEIIKPEKFWWNEWENKDLFFSKGVSYKYDHSTLKFEEPIYPNMIRVRTFVYLDIILGNTPLLDAGYVVDYHVHGDIIENLHTELRRIGEDAHNKFMKIWEERRSPLYISPTFQPTFDPEALEINILSVLQKGDEP